MAFKSKISKQDKLLQNTVKAVKKLKKGWTVWMEWTYSSIWMREWEIGQWGKAEPIKEEVLAKLHDDKIVIPSDVIKWVTWDIKTFIFSDALGKGQSYLDAEKEAKALKSWKSLDIDKKIIKKDSKKLKESTKKSKV